MKPPTATHRNMFVDTASLELSVPQSGDDQVFGLNAELNFGRQRLEGADLSFHLGVRAGSLHVRLFRCRVVPGTRYALHDQTATVTRVVAWEESESETESLKGSAAARLSGDTTRIRGGLSAEKEGTKSRTRTRSRREDDDIEFHRVAAQGSNAAPSWAIREVDGVTLRHRYLGEHNLCEVIIDSDEFEVSATFTCRARDLTIEDVEVRPRWKPSRNKHKLALAVVASALQKKKLDHVEAIDLCESRLVAASNEEPGAGRE